MIKTYFKQAIELMRQDRLFSTLYITGTGLAIAMTVIMAVIYYVKLAPVYPEENRSNTLYLTLGVLTGIYIPAHRISNIAPPVALSDA